MSHANAPLTPAGRLRLIGRCQDRPIAHVGAEAGVSRACLSKWKARYDAEGIDGLLDRSSAPYRRPTQLAPEVVDLIETWRRDKKWAARKISRELALVGHQASVATVGRWLRRLGISRRRDIDPDGSTNRQVAAITARFAGHMVHLDVKKVGRIPDGGGWRAHGRGSTQDKKAQRAKTAGARAGYVYLHSIVDCYSRLAYTEALPNETAATTIGFFHRARAFFAAHADHPHRARDHRQRVELPRPRLPAHRARRGLTPPAHPPLHPPPQRQGRALQPDPGRRAPLLPALDERGRT